VARLRLRLLRASTDGNELLAGERSEHRAPNWCARRCKSLGNYVQREDLILGVRRPEGLRALAKPMKPECLKPCGITWPELSNVNGRHLSCYMKWLRANAPEFSRDDLLAKRNDDDVTRGSPGADPQYFR
jgi:hypothetical protein